MSASLFALAAVGARLGVHEPQLRRLPAPRDRAFRGRGALCGLQHRARGLDRHARRRLHRRHRGGRRDRRPARTDFSDRFARLRLCGDHRRVRRPAASDRNPVRRPADVAPLSQRRHSRRCRSALPSSVTGLFQGTLLLPAARRDVFIHYRAALPTAVAPRRPADRSRRSIAEAAT